MASHFKEDTLINNIMRKHISLLGRIFLSSVFIIHGLIKLADFEHFWHVMDLKGIPVAPLAAVIVICIELGGGIAVLVGFYTKFFSPIMAIYLIVVTIVNFPFWSNYDFFENFIINMAIVGGLLIESYAGAGPESIDASHFFDI